MTMTEPRLIASAAVLLVRDVVAAANHYRGCLGFSYDRFWGEPPNFVMLRRDGLTLMLQQASEPAHVVPHWTVSPGMWNVYFWVRNVDALHAECVRNGAIIDYGLCDKDYGCREFGIRDLDGHDIGFGQSID